MLMTVCFKATLRRNSQLVMGRTLGKKRLLRTELRPAALYFAAEQRSFSVSNSKSLISCLWDSLCSAPIYDCLFSVTSKLTLNQCWKPPNKPWIVISEWKTMTCKTRHYFQSGSKMKAILVLLCIGLWSPPMSANPQFGMTFPDGKPILILLIDWLS